MTFGEFCDRLEVAMQESWTDVAGIEGSKIAEEFRLDLISKVKKQAFKWPPLNPDYKASKIRAGLDQRMLIATGAYLKSIESKLVETGETRVVYEVAPSKKKLKSSEGSAEGLTYRQLARIHERGSQARNIPPRPHWGPTTRKFQDMSEVYSEQLQRKFNESVGRKIREMLK